MNPGDTGYRPASNPPTTSLNEGRDVNPGDTLWWWLWWWWRWDAQRRPGRESRRHFKSTPLIFLRFFTLNEGRDVNPGDTRSRRQAPVSSTSALNEGRDVNPGDTLSCEPLRLLVGALNEGRDVNPGDTRSRRQAPVSSTSALNEGRDVNPGDTLSCEPLRLLVGALNEGRDVNPGDTPCRRRPGTPSRSLNEGRDVNPGDTLADACADAYKPIAQRRPGRESRRHRRRRVSPPAGYVRRSTKAGT